MRDTERQLKNLLEIYTNIIRSDLIDEETKRNAIIVLRDKLNELRDSGKASHAFFESLPEDLFKI
jgi:hypothetical protein